MRKWLKIVSVVVLLLALIPTSRLVAQSVELKSQRQLDRCPSCRDVWTRDQMDAFNADVDGNGHVNLIDLAIVVGNMNRPFAPLNIALYRADCNRDRSVDMTDFWLVARALWKLSPVAWQRVDFSGDGSVDAGDLGMFRGCLGKDTTNNLACLFANIVDIPGQPALVATMDLEIVLSFLRMPIPEDQIPQTPLPLLFGKGLRLPPGGGLVN